MSLQSWVSKKYGFVSPVRVSLREVEVQIDVKDVEDLVDAYALEVDRKYPLGKLSNVLNVDMLSKFITTLLVLRIDFVTRKRAFREYDLRLYAVPAFVAAYSMGIGIVEDHEFGLVLKPTCLVTKQDLLTPQEMETFSRIIRSLRDAFRPVDFPMIKEGNLEFMSKYTVDIAVKSYRSRDHVVSAFLSSVVKKTVRDEVILALSSVNYGDATVFRREIPITETDHEESNV